MAKSTLSTIEKLLVKKRDEFLVKSALQGDSGAFEILMEFYRKRVTALGMSFFKNPDDTDDFVQEVFVKVYIHLASFNFKSSFATWVTKIAYNQAISSINRRKEYYSIADENILEAKNLTPEEEQIHKLTLETIRESVQNLPDNYSACIEMFFFHGLSHEEISEITGFPVNTIKSHIFRAKKLLAEKLRGLNEQ